MSEKTFGAIIREERARYGLSQKELATKAEVSQASVSRIEKNIQANLTEDTKTKLLLALGLPEEGGHSLSDAPLIFSKPIPVISWVHAGAFVDAKERWPSGVSADSEPVFSSVRTGSNAFGLRIESDSMLPRFMPGDVAIVDPSLRCDDGSPCVVWVNGEVSLKLFWDLGGEIVLKAMNNKYPEIVIRKDSNVDFRVIGKVVDSKPKL
jgi:SOS-response transcriptional repressor LexA